MGIIQVSEGEFEKEVLQSEKLVLVDFWAPWCGPCQIVGPVLEKISEEYDGEVKICKVNVDENRSVAARYQILSIPTLLFFKNGKVLNQLVGGRPAADIKNTINSLLAKNNQSR